MRPLEELVRPNIRTLKPYSTARDEFSGGEITTWLDANENPYDNGVNRYPDPHQKLLKQKIAALKGVREEQVFIGNGSDEAIDLCYRIFCRPGVDNAVSIAPTYGMYRVAADINDVEMREVPLGADFSLPTDALLAAQNLCVEAEMNGLGICYLGTTIYTAGMIAEILELPKGVIPVTTIVLGYPDESPELTDRLPLEAVVHYEKYTDYTAAEIDELWAEREESELTKRLLEENGLPNLAQIFTQRRYVREDNLSISNSYFALLKEKGFFNN